jgi:hypothetical protein
MAWNAEADALREMRLRSNPGASSAFLQPLSAAKQKLARASASTAAAFACKRRHGSARAPAAA